MSKRPKEIEDAITKADISTLELIRFIEKERDDQTEELAAQIEQYKEKLSDADKALDDKIQKNNEAQSRIKELEREIEELRSQLNLEKNEE